MPALALLWTRIVGIVKSIPDWAWWAFIAIATGKFIDMRARAAEREKAKLRRAIEEQKSIVVAHEMVNEIEENSDAMVRQAESIRRANPVIGDPDVVPDAPAGSPRRHYRSGADR